MDKNETTTNSPEEKKLGDVRFIAAVLGDTDLDWTIENAQAILAKGRANKPAAWTITPEELPAPWAATVGNIEETR